MAKWIEFVILPREKIGEKTTRWQVIPKEQERAKQHPLGVVKWYGGFRRYSFFPAPNTIFEQQCLRDIADFCQEQTRIYNTEKKEPTHE